MQEAMKCGPITIRDQSEEEEEPDERLDALPPELLDEEDDDDQSLRLFAAGFLCTADNACVRQLNSLS